nr:hypothetical protein [Micromonospora sp. DSM 115978]
MPDGLDRGTVRLGLFVGALVATLVAGFVIGRLVGGADPTPARDVVTDHTHAPGVGPHDHGPTDAPGGHDDGHALGTSATVGEAGVGGLSLSAAGYTLAPVEASFPAGTGRELAFRVLDAQRQPVTRFAVVHDKPMHLIVVRRDLSGYQHLHPTMAPDGTWRVPVSLPEPGIWRAYADFAALDADGAQVPVTLGVDLVVAGDYRPRPLPAAAREATVDGFTVTYQGTPQVGASAPLLLRVFADGSPVTDLEPYLGAYGHLVALRGGDLGYLHVHPEEALDPGGGVKFWLTAPSPGQYRLFFDFQVAGVVRTAEFTLVVP